MTSRRVAAARLAMIAALAAACLAILGCAPRKQPPERNEYGGSTLRIDSPDSPDADYRVEFRDSRGRLRKLQVHYPLSFLKEDPRTLGVFYFDDRRRVVRAESWFSSRFIADNAGLYAEIVDYDVSGKPVSRELRYDGRDPSKPASVRDGGPPGELPIP